MLKRLRARFSAHVERLSNERTGGYRAGHVDARDMRLPPGVGRLMTEAEREDFIRRGWIKPRPDEARPT